MAAVAQQAQPKDLMTVSVIVPALNEAQVLGRCLAALAAQTLRRDAFEVLVVDNGSTDGTVAVARGFESELNLRVASRPGVYISAVRNFGAALASGRILAFLDADCLAPPDWLERATRILDRNSGAVIGAHYRIPPGSSWVARAWYEDHHKKYGKVSYIPSGNLFAERGTFQRLRGFDESLETNEDYDFCRRAASAGFPVLAFPELSVEHLGTPQTLARFYRKHRWQGSAVHKVFLRDVRRFPNAKAILFAATTLASLLAGAASIPLSWVEPGFRWLLLAPLVPVLGSFALAVQAALGRRRAGIVFPLTVLYAAYGLARATCLLGGKATRAAAGPGAGRLGIHTQP